MATDTDLRADSGKGGHIRDPLQLGNLRIDPDSYRVSVGDQPVDLTRQEYDLLFFLAQDAGRIHSYANLALVLWPTEGQAPKRRLNVVACRVRAKIARAEPYQLETVRGRGYGLLARRTTA